VVSFALTRGRSSRSVPNLAEVRRQAEAVRAYHSKLNAALVPVIEDPKGHLFEPNTNFREVSERDLGLISDLIDKMISAETAVAGRVAMLKVAFRSWPPGTSPEFLNTMRNVHNDMVDTAEHLRDARWQVMALRAEITSRTEAGEFSSISELRRAVNALRA
jgi:hypothetical protein